MDGSDGVRNWAPAWAPPSALAADGMGPWGGARSPRTGALLPGIKCYAWGSSLGFSLGHACRRHVPSFLLAFSLWSLVVAWLFDVVFRRQ